MNSDPSIPELERRLRSEAERLGALDSVPVPSARLHAGYIRGRRRRAVRTAATVLVPALLLLVGWLALTERAGSRAAPERSMAQPDAPGIVPEFAPDGNRPAPAPVEGGVAEPEIAALRSGGPAAGGLAPLAIPIVIIHVEGDREVVAPGFLVPAHDTPLDFRDLSPAEQRAVRQVLDLEVEPHQAI